MTTVGSTALRYKEDWGAARQRFLAWWNREPMGRCAIAVTAPRANAARLMPPPDPITVEQKWMDLDYHSRCMTHGFTGTYYGGEAIPVWNAGYAGVSAIPTFLGCRIDLDMETGWWHPVLTDPDTLDYRSLKLDESSAYYRFTMEMLERAVRECRGRALPTIGAFGGSGDTLAAVRGTEQLLIDCVERPDEVRAAEEHLMDVWIDFYERCYRIIRETAGGSTCWFALWSPGRFYAAQNDFSYNISPAMFRKLFLPVIDRQTRFLDHSIYHVDGVNAFAHVAALCELPRLQALQILPGAGKPSPLHYLGVLRQVQAAGKNLHISLPIQEVETALSHLSARGLFISTSAETEAEARDLLGKAERWSRDR